MTEPVPPLSLVDVYTEADAASCPTCDGDMFGTECPTCGPPVKWSDLSYLDRGESPTTPDPTFLRRADGERLLYPGALNYVFGNPDAGKSWIALAAIAEALRDGETAVYIDADHNTEPVITDRLLKLGVPRFILTMSSRYRHYEPEDARELASLLRHVARTMEPGIIVFDSAGEVISLLGLDSNNNDDLTKWNRTTHIPIIQADWCVVVLDHLTKAGNEEWPIGGMAKKRFTTGLMIHVEVDRPLAPEKLGSLWMNIRKDRHGKVKAVSAASAGRFLLDSADESITWAIEVPIVGDPEPTRAMEEISLWLEAHASDGKPVKGGQKAIVDGVRAAGNGMKEMTMRRAFRCLVNRGHIETVSRKGTRFISPFREADAG